MNVETDARLLALETKVAYQEKLLAELNDVLVEHTQALRELVLRSGSLERLLRESTEEKPGHERPPHY